MSLLPNALRIRDDFPFVLKRVIPAAQPVANPAPVVDWSQAMPSDNAPKRVRLHLTDEAQELADDYESIQIDRGCNCWQIQGPCSLCLHEGHPDSLASDDSYWVMGVAA